jgi:TetR/AcrR family transcriptional repressor of nem operon
MTVVIQSSHAIRKDHKAQTRGRILRAAARRFREKGFLGSGVDDVMREAGLTAGGFYAHFNSKGDLLREVLAHALRETRDRLLPGLEDVRGVPWFREIGALPEPRAPGRSRGGCARSSLGAEVGRMGEDARRTFEAHLRDLIAEVGDRAPASTTLGPRDRALATRALFAGSLMLSRAIADRALSDRILLASRRLALAGLEEVPPSTEKKP